MKTVLFFLFSLFICRLKYLFESANKGFCDVVPEISFTPNYKFLPYFIIAHSYVMNKGQDSNSNFKVNHIEKSGNFTCVPNHILRSKRLSLKAKGFLCMILSLPPNWYFSISGITAICKEGKSAVKTALAELEELGYLSRSKLMPNNTNSGRIEHAYEFNELSEIDISDNNIKKKDSQEIEKQSSELQPTELQLSDYQREINTGNIILEKEILYNQKSIHQSSAVNENAVEKVETTDDGMIEEYAKNQIEYTELVKNNIDFDSFADWLQSKAEAEEIVQIMVRQICSNNPTEVICKNEYSREVVKSTLLKADIEVLENAIEQINDIDCIRNREKYLVSTIFNEVNTKHFKENSIDRWAENAVARDFGDQIF